MGLPRRLASAARMKKAWENYVDYLQNYDQRENKVGQGKAKPAQKELFIHPFGTTFDAESFFSANATEARWESYKSHFTSHAKEALVGANGEISFKVKGFKPARMVIKEGVSASGNSDTSKRTKMPYLNYGGVSGSIPFGASTGSDEELAVFSAIKTALTATNFNKATTKISRIKEKI